MLLAVEGGPPYRPNSSEASDVLLSGLQRIGGFSRRRTDRSLLGQYGLTGPLTLRLIEGPCAEDL